MISVCIACHNGEKYIKEELLSILPQLGVRDEIVISDDGSTDETKKEILSLSDDRIKIVTIEHDRKGMRPHYYVTKNFENAIKHAKGDVIFLADQDDIWMANKVEKCLSVLKDNVAVMHNLQCVDGSLIPLGYNWYSKAKSFKRLNYLMTSKKHMGCALCFKKELLKVILPFPKELHTHDYWIGILAELHGGLHFHDNILIKYRIHGTNTSIGGHHRNSIFFKIRYRLYTLYHVWKRRNW